MCHGWVMLDQKLWDATDMSLLCDCGLVFGILSDTDKTRPLIHVKAAFHGVSSRRRHVAC